MLQFRQQVPPEPNRQAETPRAAAPAAVTATAKIAAAVAEVAFRDGLAEIERPDDLLGYVHSQMYEPVYASYVR